MIWLKRLCVGPAAALLAMLAIAGPARAEPAMWVIKDADSTIVLFGSVHMLPKDLDWRPKRLTEAIDAADDIWFEIPLDVYAAQAAAAEAGRHAMLPPGQTLSSLLDARTRERLERQARSLHLLMADLDQLQPWLAEVRISLAALEQRDGITADGVEDQVNFATPPKAIRRAFETPIHQIDILAGDDIPTQAASLAETLRQLETDPRGYQRMLKAWLAGDAKALTHEVIDPMREKTPKSYQSLVVNRNAAWADIIAKRLAGSGRTVMVVGTGHLIGPDSVPAMLRARGIAVDGP